MTEFTSEVITDWKNAIKVVAGVRGEMRETEKFALEALDEIERLQKRIAELEAQQRWIPVSDKENLPRVGTEILGWEVRRGRYVLDWLKNREMLSKAEPTFLFSFDYWHALPQPPKEGE